MRRPIPLALAVALSLPSCFAGPRIHARGLEEVRRGYAYLEQGDLERAEVAFSHALAYHDEFPEALNGAGVVAHQRGDLVAARRRFEQALRAAPEFAEALVNLGALELAEGQPERGEARFRAALRIDPDLLPARLDLARALLHRGRTDPARREALLAEARREYLHLLESHPDLTDAHAELAWLDHDAHRFDRAADGYRAALRSAPDRVDALVGLCLSLARTPRCGETLESCRRCLAVAPDAAACAQALSTAQACAVLAR